MKGIIMNLQERVQRMLEGEQRRRIVALKWISEIEEILLPVSEDIWGTGDNFAGIPSNTITLTKLDKDNKKKNTCIYFRYINHEEIDTEYVGFYECNNCNVFGKPLEELRGKEFWYAIQTIMGWIPQVIAMMDRREESRNALLDKIK
jgi:hypothetical protein